MRIFSADRSPGIDCINPQRGPCWDDFDSELIDVVGAGRKTQVFLDFCFCLSLTEAISVLRDKESVAIS